MDPMQLTRALDVLVDWRLAAAPEDTRIVIRWREGGGELALDWVESAPYHASSPAGRCPDDATGTLALALLARVVHEHGGQFDHAKAPTFRVNLRWPSRIRERETGRGRGPSHGGRP